MLSWELRICRYIYNFICSSNQWVFLEVGGGKGHLNTPICCETVLRLFLVTIHRAVIKGWGPGISPGCYECGPWLLSLENRRKIEPKEIPSCLIPCQFFIPGNLKSQWHPCNTPFARQPGSNFSPTLQYWSIILFYYGLIDSVISDLLLLWETKA